MKKTMKKFIATFLVVAIVLCSAPLSGLVGLELPDWVDFTIKSSAATYNGTCGDNLTWSLDTDTGVLKINGTGAMTVYSKVPWYSYKSSITSVSVGDSVTSIGSYAFYNCTSLTSITIPDSVTSIGSYAFRDCTGLTSITIPDSVTSIGESAFCGTLYYNDESNWENDVLYIDNYLLDTKSSIIGNYEIKSGTTVIADSAFYYCDSLTSITIPESVTSIGSSSFYKCTSLTSITIPDSVTSIGSSSFYNCASLTSISIPDSVTSIGDYAFYICSLTSITIPDSVTSIGDYAFYYCDSLTSITIPDSVTSIGDDAFKGTSYYNDKSNWKNDVLYIDNYLLDAKSSIIGNYEIKSGTTVIADSAFYYCDSLTSITIPDSITNIGNSAFSSCNNIEDVYYCGTKAEWDKIYIGSDNNYLKNANIYYHYGRDCEVVVESAVAPTCTATGLTEGSHCSLCDKVFVQQQVVKATGHTEVIDKAVAPTCTETGHTEGSHCSVCGENFVEQEVVEAIGHIDNNNDGVCDTCNEQFCICGCHKTGIAKFFWSIGHFFRNLFGNDEICACGKSH